MRTVSPAQATSRLIRARLLLAANRAQTSSIQFQQLVGIVLGLGSRSSARESDATSRGGTSVPGGHGDKLHQIECDVFVTAGMARTCGGSFFHDSFSSSGNDRDIFVVLEVLHSVNDGAVHNSGWDDAHSDDSRATWHLQVKPSFFASNLTRFP